MNKLNEILSQIGISKVKLAKYLGVSRQMVYNYLEMDNVNEWPLEKKMKLFNLFDISSSEEIESLKVDNEFIKRCNNLINLETDNNIIEGKGNLSFQGLSQNDSNNLNDIIFLLKDRLMDDETEETSNMVRYLYYFLQALDSTPEIKYILGYVAKTTGFIDPNEFLFEKENQFNFESIFFSAMVLYSNGSTSPERLAESHRKFENKITQIKEEKLSRTQELITVKEQALRELGYTEITDDNVTEVFEKIAEIQSRKF